ncbi:MAG: MBL fold metallo-hydrolase [Micrococcales bacterium]|nr:MBL fold metallo-hydrolase [Micrococcales bacterium]MCL2666286.1 MBL fold metallo-hydrolase [Micrococcales bacterium]
MLRVTFLGTSAGAPTTHRNVSGIAVGTTLGPDWFLVDAGEGTQHQVLGSALSLHRLRMVFITHAHGDHCLGLPGLLASAGMAGRTAPLAVWAPRTIATWLDQTLAATTTHLPYELDVRHADEVTTWPWDDHVTFHARPLRHRVPSHALEVDASVTTRRLDVNVLDGLGVPRGPLWGRLQSGEPVVHEGATIAPDQVSAVHTQRRRAIVGGDNGDPAILEPYVEGLDLLVHEATYTATVAAQVGDWPMHSSAAQVATFAERCAIPNLVLTHFSARYETLDDLAAEASEHYHGTLALARDGDTYTLDPTGTLQPGNHIVLRQPARRG